MKTSPLSGQQLDDIVFNIALVFLIMVATLAALSLASPWVVLGCMAFYIAIGLGVVCVLPKDGTDLPPPSRKDRSALRPPVPPLSSREKAIADRAHRKIA